MLARLLALVLVPVAIQAQVMRDSIITVNTARSFRVSADRASLFVSVEGTAETAREAVSRAEAKLAAVTAALRGARDGVEMGAPVTFSVGPTMSARGFPGAPAAPSLTARAAIRVQVTRLSYLAPAVSAALDAGAAGASSVVFESTSADSTRRAVVVEALTDARKEAEAIAASLGGRVGALVDVSTSGGDRGFQGPTVFAFDGGFGQQGFAPEVLLNVTVIMRFRLIR